MAIPAEYNQQPGETLNAWKYRMIFAKTKKECKLSWNEICDMLSLGCSGEYLRKIAYGIKEYADYVEEETEERSDQYYNADEITEMENKEFQLRREKMRMQDQKRELNKLLREWARAEHIQREIGKAVENAAKQHPLKFKKRKHEFKNREAALILSDWHKGLKTINLENTFNDAVFIQRITELVEKTVEYGHDHKVKTIHVFALGDLINGLIHVTTRINNTEDVIKQSMSVAETLCNIVGTLSEEFEEVKVYFARGNHDRVTPNKKESIAGESFFDVVPWYLQARLEGIKNVELVENQKNDEIIVANIMGSKIFAVHGHNDKVSNVVQNLSLMLKEFPNYIFMGHYHHNAEDEIHGAEVIVNSSLSGTDDYAIDIRSTAKPAQKLIIFNENGRLCTYNIRLDVNK
jgi:UDP-2,3-diacylglucosamine pyrophosphatase LpxH